MKFYFQVLAAVLVAVAVGYCSTAKAGCPQGQCFQQQQVFAQQVYQPQAVVLQNVAPQYVVQQPQFVVQQQYAQAVVVGHNRQQVIVQKQRAQRVVVQNQRQRSRQTVIVRSR